MQEWVSDHVVLLSVISGITVVLGLVGAVVVAVALPEDYFVTQPEHGHRKGLGKKVAKNLLGIVAILLGVVMSLPLVPGPGIIILLVGLSMTDFPGKRKLEVKLLRFPGLLTQINKLREKFGKKPLKLPEKKHSLSSQAVSPKSSDRLASPDGRGS